MLEAWCLMPGEGDKSSNCDKMTRLLEVINRTNHIPDKSINQKIISKLLFTAVYYLLISCCEGRGKILYTFWFLLHFIKGPRRLIRQQPMCWYRNNSVQLIWYWCWYTTSKSDTVIPESTNFVGHIATLTSPPKETEMILQKLKNTEKELFWILCHFVQKFDLLGGLNSVDGRCHHHFAFDPELIWSYSFIVDLTTCCEKSTICVQAWEVLSSSSGLKAESTALLRIQRVVIVTNPTTQNEWCCRW